MNAGRGNSYVFKNKIPFYIGYFTAWVDDNGQINFFDDVYVRDDRLARLIFDKN